MVWDIYVRRSHRHDDRVLRVKARWAEVGPIDDVSLDCGSGVHQVGPAPAVRRRMTALSRPIEADFRWDGETVQPEVVLTWCDGGEVCEHRIPLVPSEPRHALSRFLLAERRR